MQKNSLHINTVELYDNFFNGLFLFQLFYWSNAPAPLKRLPPNLQASVFYVVTVLFVSWFYTKGHDDQSRSPDLIMPDINRLSAVHAESNVLKA